jgi:glutaminyl-tRNA synthetase
VRLRYGYFITCQEVVKDASGNIVELRCTYDPATRGGDAPDGRKVQGTIHWVSARHAIDAEVRLYERLFSVPVPDADAPRADEDDAPNAGDGEADRSGAFMTHLNPASLVVVRNAKVEPSVSRDPVGTRYQFERTGYFITDVVDSRDGALVFNRTVTLRDSWAKMKDR